MLAATARDAYAKLYMINFLNMAEVWCSEADSCIEKVAIYISRRVVARVVCGEAAVALKPNDITPLHLYFLAALPRA